MAATYFHSFSVPEQVGKLLTRDLDQMLVIP
jgi:hypothetical protein